MQNVFVHPKALCESEQIGRGTRVWAFAHVLAGARVGSDCNLCDGVFVENDVTIGDRVTIKCGVQLWDGTRLEDDVFIGPNATFTNDRFPRSRRYPEKFKETIVRRGASVGANATILPGLEIGSGAMVGAGAVVTRSVPPNAIVAGNPARIIGYVEAEKFTYTPRKAEIDQLSLTKEGQRVGVGNSSLHELRVVRDLRGSLSVAEFEREIPFIPKRYFVIYDVPSREVRGEHAHKECHQFLICLQGSCGVLLDDGESRRELTLDRPELGLFLPAMTWSTQFRYTENAVLLVFASDYYDPDDYIRTYNEYKALLGRSTI